MAHPVPDDPDTLLSRAEIAEALTAAGYPISKATLATMASRGGGPLYRSFGKHLRYRWSEALAWAQTRLSPPRGITSEADGQRRAPR